MPTPVLVIDESDCDGLLASIDPWSSQSTNNEKAYDAYATDQHAARCPE